MDDIKQEFWGDLQVELVTKNTAVYLANQRLESLISQDGRKAHRPLLSHASGGTYVPHSDITFKEKKAEKQTLEVDTFEYRAEDIDDTETSQSPYALLQQSLASIRWGLMNAFEQKYLAQIPNALHKISGSPVALTTVNALDVVREAGSKLGSYDVPRGSDMRAWVVGPNTAEILRQIKSQRETGLGDTTLENGVIGPWHGWTVVENNNLPWSATLTIATKPTDGDTVTISGVTFTFKTTLGTTPGNVLIGANAAAARANLKDAVEGGAGSGSTYVDLSVMNDFIIRRKRNVKCSSAEAMAFTGNGDISVSETLTAVADVWSAQKQESIFMIRGAIDAVMQFVKLETPRKQAGFADLPKGVIGMGAKMFSDGAISSVELQLDASNF